MTKQDAARTKLLSMLKPVLPNRDAWIDPVSAIVVNREELAADPVTVLKRVEGARAAFDEQRKPATNKPFDDLVLERLPGKSVFGNALSFSTMTRSEVFITGASAEYFKPGEIRSPIQYTSTPKPQIQKQKAPQVIEFKPRRIVL